MAIYCPAVLHELVDLVQHFSFYFIFFSTLSLHFVRALIPGRFTYQIFFFYFLFHDLSRIGSRTGMSIYTPTHIFVMPVLLFTTIEVSVVFFLAGLIRIFPR